MNKITNFIKYLFRSYNEYDINRLVSALAYNSLFSIAPIFILLLKFASPVLKDSIIEQFVREEAGQVVGDKFIQSYIQNVDKVQKFIDFGEIFTVFTFLFILITAISFLEEVKHSLNVIFDVHRERKLRKKLKNMFVGFIGIIILTIFLLLFVVIESYANFISQLALFDEGAFVTILRSLNIIINISLLTGLFSIIFKYLPDIKIRKRDAFLGGLITALLFLIGQLAISVYFSSYLVTQSYALSASLIIFLLWVYLCCQIFMVGALITKYISNKGNF